MSSPNDRAPIAKHRMTWASSSPKSRTVIISRVTPPPSTCCKHCSPARDTKRKRIFHTFIGTKPKPLEDSLHDPRASRTFCCRGANRVAMIENRWPILKALTRARWVQHSLWPCCPFSKTIPRKTSSVDRHRNEIHFLRLTAGHPALYTSYWRWVKVTNKNKELNCGGEGKRCTFTPFQLAVQFADERDRERERTGRKSWRTTWRRWQIISRR